MATATATAPTIRIGPHDHGRRMTLDEFIEADFQEGWLYELARGVVEVTEIPGPWHGRIVRRVARMFDALRRSTPRSHQILRWRRRMPDEAAGHGLRPPSGPGDLPRSRTPGPEGLDKVDPAHRRRGRQPGRRGSRLHRQARRIPASGRPRILDPRPRKPSHASSSVARATPGKKRSCPRPARIRPSSSPASKSGPQNCSDSLRQTERKYISDLTAVRANGYANGS